MKNLIIYGEPCVKYGKDKAGNQKYKRKIDGKIITENVKPRYGVDIKLLSILLYFNGLTLSKIGNMFCVCHVTVSNWINSLASEILNHQITDIQEVRSVEIDEIYHYIDSKKKDYMFSRQLTEKHIN